MSENVKTILIIDDEIFIRQSFADYFEDKLWLVFQAESGELALNMLENQSVDCAIVDVRLEGIDGDEFIRRALVKKPEMAFVICTGSPEYEIPTDLRNSPRLSRNVYRKPVMNMGELEKELLGLIL